jgi:hypothetical protein
MLIVMAMAHTIAMMNVLMMRPSLQRACVVATLQIQTVMAIILQIALTYVQTIQTSGPLAFVDVASAIQIQIVMEPLTAMIIALGS